MAAVWQLFRKLSLKNKLIVSYAPIIFLAILLCFFYFNYMVNQQTSAQICAAKVSSLKNISNNIEYIKRNIVNISNAYLFDNHIQDFVKPTADENAYDKSKRYSTVTDILSKQKNIFFNMDFYTSVYSFNKQDYVTNSPTGRIETDAERVEHFIQSGDVDYTRLTWTAAEQDNGYPTVCAYRYIINSYTGEPVGMMIFDFENSVFSNTYNNYISSSEELLLVTADGKPLSSSEPVASDFPLQDGNWFSELDGFQEGYFFADGAKKPMCISFVKLKNPDWYLVSRIPKKIMFQAFESMPSYAILICAIIAAVFLCITILLSKYISKPILKLTGTVSAYHRENGMEPIENQPFHGDEIRYLGKQYHLMTQRTNQLIERIVEEQEKKRIFEMQALQGQINPHFLYNTLNSIRLFNKNGDRDTIDKAIQALARILHSLFKEKATTHLVREEIEQLKDYILIQQMRYGNNFEATVSCVGDVSDLPIAKLLIQPIVENSIFHGVSGYESGGLIQIRFLREQGFLVVEVEDNGQGFVQKVQAAAPLAVSNGIGLSNTKERIRLIYGEQGTLEIDSKIGQGSKVRLRFPLNKEGIQNEDYDCG